MPMRLNPRSRSGCFSLSPCSTSPLIVHVHFLNAWLTAPFSSRLLQAQVSLPKIACRFINTYPQQRVAWSMDSPHHNPHGEESEDCWLIEDTLSDTCLIQIKHITQT